MFPLACSISWVWWFSSMWWMWSMWSMWSMSPASILPRRRRAWLPPRVLSCRASRARPYRVSCHHLCVCDS
jgi:hypothetical protein